MHAAARYFPLRRALQVRRARRPEGDRGPCDVGTMRVPPARPRAQVLRDLPVADRSPRSVTQDSAGNCVGNLREAFEGGAVRNNCYKCYGSPE